MVAPIGPSRRRLAHWSFVFADICSQRTVANLRGQPVTEINVVDPIRRKGYRFKGRGRVVDRGPDYEAGVEFFRQRGVANPIRSVVFVRVERAEALISPVYDTGATEAEVVERWLKRTVDRLGSPRQAERDAVPT